MPGITTLHPQDEDLFDNERMSNGSLLRTAKDGAGVKINKNSVSMRFCS